MKMEEETVLTEELAGRVLPELPEEELKELGMHSSEIRNFRVEKTTLRPGETTACTGELWHCLFHTPECNRKKGTVQLLSDDVKVDETYTETGYFRLTYRAPMTEGTYFVRARHPGVPVIQSGCESDRVPVEVVKEKEERRRKEREKKPPERPWLKWALIGAAGVGVGLAAMEAT